MYRIFDWGGLKQCLLHFLDWRRTRLEKKLAHVEELLWEEERQKYIEERVEDRRKKPRLPKERIQRLEDERRHLKQDRDEVAHLQARSA